MTATTNPAPSFDAIAPGTVVVFRKLGNRSRGAFRPDRVEPLQGAGDAIFMTGHRVKLSNGVVSWKRTHVILSPGFDELLEVREPAPAADTATTKEATMTEEHQPTTMPELRHAIAMLDSVLAMDVTSDPAAIILQNEARERRTRYVDQLAELIRQRLDALDGPAVTGTRPAVEIDEDREMLIAELARLGTVRYPAGTPEHDAYRAELTTELAKFAAGEAPYDVKPETFDCAACGRKARTVEHGDEHVEPHPHVNGIHVPVRPADREAVAAALAPVVDQLADAADPESRARAELAKLQAKNSMRRSADLIAIDLLPHLAETFAFIRGEQPTAEGRAAIDQLADALTGWVPGFVELVGFEWRKLEEIADGDDSTCSVCGVELPGIGAHDVGKHEEHRKAERHEARMAKLRTERPELFADKPAGPDHSPGAANTLPDVECADPKHCPLIDADGETVPVPECFSGDLNAARLFYAGRVKVECGHYTSKSERNAGFKTCERC